MIKSDAFKLVVWALSPPLLAWLLHAGFNFPFLNPLACALLGVGIFLFTSHALQKNGLSQTLEAGLATFFIGVFIIHFGFVVFAPYVRSQMNDEGPCSPSTKEAQCYELSKEACVSAWDHYQTECKAEIAAAGTRPTQLIGPTLQLCTRKKFAKYMSYNTKNTADEGCQNYFKTLKEGPPGED